MVAGAVQESRVVLRGENRTSASSIIWSACWGELTLRKVSRLVRL
jgi:hypothetical protein